MAPLMWHSMAPEEALKSVEGSSSGLSESQVERRLKQYGENRLKAAKKKNIVLRFLEQFNDLLIFILIAAAVVSGFLGEVLDTIVILAIVVLNAVFGFLQEYKAERSLEALRNMMAPEASVRRNGKEKRIPANQIVPGDILLIHAGDKIAADCRLVEAFDLKVDESSLTGESVPVAKQVDSLSESTSLADRSCMVYMGTIATYGRGVAVVVATGMETEMGRIAGLVESVVEEATPLQQRLDGLAKQIGVATLVVCAVVFTVGWLSGKPALEMFMESVSLAVAAVPEGLPATITITLALGVQRMVKRNAVLRKLPAVETLGAATVIASDKTGTLTQNEMTVRQARTLARNYEVSGDGYAPVGEFTEGGRVADVKSDSDLVLMLRAAVLCNDATLRKESGRWAIEGDPTEAALVVLAGKGGVLQDVRKEAVRVKEVPFDGARKRMTTVHKEFGVSVAYVKGAPEVLLPLCKRAQKNGKETAFSEAQKKKVLLEAEDMAGRALRVLAFAYKKIPEGEKGKNLEEDLVYIGIVGMMDPPRPEVAEAVARCKAAGIRPIIITGDHPLTAKAVAKEIGLETKGVLSGVELDALSEAELHKKVLEVSVYARVSPEHKLRIIHALKKHGHIVAMTGDGVNDAPALKRADIGVAMGITGTDVSKEASDMVLTDDNFASIVAAVEEGRMIYANIRKFILFLLSSNVGEILIIFFGILLGVRYNWPLPLMPIQLLWVNLVTDGLPALALAVDPPDGDVMKKPPRRKNEDVISRTMLKDMLVVGLVFTVGTLWVLSSEAVNGDVKAQAMAFTTLVVFEMFNVFNCRSESGSVLSLRGLLGNKYLLAAVGSSMLLQCTVIYVPTLQPVFSTVALSAFDWVKIILVSSTVLWAVEIRKRIWP
ncbi:Potassium-transporting ATPase ATP-binding subunit [uncultured archaeon]|nr:Potassium-transporting ATPase ATP-binding subunit [uncultured archaeon]